MPFWVSLLCFGIPAGIIFLGIYVGFPALDRAGVPMFLNFMLFTAGPLVLMFAAYKLKNTTPGIISHWIQNGIGLILITLGILGLGSLVVFSVGMGAVISMTGSTAVTLDEKIISFRGVSGGLLILFSLGSIVPKILLERLRR